VPPLPRGFYDRPTLEVARDLLGRLLVHRVRGVTTAGAVVEVEAYIGEADPACHAACGPTRRNAPLYGAPGFAYVYLNYGIHCLMNVVTEPAGSPAAVLIRALEPVDGLAVMRRRRRRGAGSAPGRPDLDEAVLCRGPGNLSRAMGITLRHNGADVCGGRLSIEDDGRPVGRVAWTPRIGIRVGTELRWRAFVVGSEAVSPGRLEAGGRRR
jgi:DNA-3-methyladenine glycosylase